MKIKNQLLPGLIALALAGCGGETNSTTADKDSAIINTSETKQVEATVAANPLKDCFFGDMQSVFSASSKFSLQKIKSYK